MPVQKLLLSSAFLAGSLAQSPAGWLQKGLHYRESEGLSDEAQAYLAGTAEPVRQWQGRREWQNAFINAMEKLPTGVDVDDHQGTPIGEGESIGLVAAEFTMDKEQLALLPKAFQTGLFEACQTACSPWPTLLRMSHTLAGGQEVMRISMKVGASAEVDLTFTETLQSFPISNRRQLEAFSYSVANGPLAAFAKYPGAMTAIAKNTVVDQKYAEEVKKYGILGKVFHSLTPYMIGSHSTVPGAMKYRLVPAAEQRMAYPNVTAAGSVKKAMRTQLVGALSEADYSFNFEIQVATNAGDQPIDDANAEWKEETAPWVRMGKLRIPKQDFAEPVTVGNVVGSGLWSGGHAPFNSKEFLFAPGLTAHAPLGDINTFRADLYVHYDQARQQHLLGKKGGTPAKCPFSEMARWLQNHPGRAVEEMLV